MGRRSHIGLIAIVGSIVFAACATVVKSPNVFPLVATTVRPLANGDKPTLARQQYEPGGAAFRLREHTVVMPFGCDRVRTKRLLAGVDYIRAGFESDYGPIPRPLLIFITDREHFQMEMNVWWIPPAMPGTPQFPQRQMLNIIGVCCGDDEIAVISGERDGLPALYHEFCHIWLDPTNDHQDARWELWRRRGAELSKHISKTWY